MNKTKYNQLRKAIISAVPEIVELKRGCRIISQVNYATQKFDNIIIGNKIIGTNHYPVSYNVSVNEDQIVEIIGRDILLADCLIAIENKALVNEDGEPTFVMINDNGMIQSELYNWEEEPVFWRMGKSLDKQDKLVIDLLWDLICKDG